MIRLVLVVADPLGAVLERELIQVEGVTVCLRQDGVFSSASVAQEAAAGPSGSVAPKVRPPVVGTVSDGSQDLDSALYAVARFEDGYPDLHQADASLEVLAASGFEQVVVLSSTAIHQPDHHNPGQVDEGYLPRGRQESSLASDWRAFEKRAKAAFAGSETRLTVLRVAALVGERGLDTSDPGNLTEGSLTFTLPGFEPELQFLAPEDLAAAIEIVLEQRAAGTFHVVPDESVPLRRALRLAGVRHLALPSWVQNLGGGERSSEKLAWRRHSATASGDRLRDLGFRPGQTSAQAIWKARGLNSELAELAARSSDPFGQDRDYIDRLGRHLFRFLHDVYWRVDERGLEHVPLAGRAVLVGVHRGFMPWDGVMALHALARARGRYPRFLIHPSLVKVPFLAPYMRRLGGLLACNENASWVLERESIVGVFPEGIQGAFRSYKKAYELGRFGRDGFVRMALRHRAPIIPFVTVGSAETFPILKKLQWKWWQQITEWPSFPITPTMGLVPLPSKWHSQFLPAIPVGELYPPEAAEDRKLVRAISQDVRLQLQTSLEDLLSRRKSIFHGSIFQSETDPVAPTGVSK